MIRVGRNIINIPIRHKDNHYYSVLIKRGKDRIMEDGRDHEDSRFEYDLVTIGAGSGGVRASRIAAGTYGAKVCPRVLVSLPPPHHPPCYQPSSNPIQVAIVELPFGFVSSGSAGGAGGTCVIRGCVPKKLLVYASEFAEAYEDAAGFGWGSADTGVTRPPHSMARLISRKAKEIERLNGVYKSILHKSGVEYMEGKGVVLDAHTVEVRGVDGSVRQLRTRNILIATGGHAVKIDIPGAQHAITSDEALVVDDLRPGDPVVIVGGGYIGVEFSGIFKGLGADVHLVCRQPYPLGAFDGECRMVVAENMRSRGIHMHMCCTPTAITTSASNSQCKLTLEYKDHNGNVGHIEAAKVMFATGRRPSTKGLGLEDCGVKLDEKTGAVVVDQHSRSSVPNIWAIGDVTGRLALTPVALMEGKALAATLFGGNPTKPVYDYIPTAVFTQPPLSSVGYTEEAAKKELSGEVDVFVSKFRPMKNTLSGREEKTFMKMLVHVGTDKVVGCHMVGPDAAEIMQGLAIALKCGATKSQFDSTVGIHPSAAEEWVTMSSPARRVRCEGGKMP